MFEQLDLFMESVNVEEEEEKRLPQESHLTPRQWALYRLIKYNSLVLHRKTSKREICYCLSDYGYEWNDDEKTHDNCSAIWKDVKDNNESLEHDKIIITEDDFFWIGSKEETKKFLRKLWAALSPRLSRYWRYVQKVGYDGTGRLFDKNGNPINNEDEDISARFFHECFNDYDITQNNFVEEKED